MLRSALRPGPTLAIAVCAATLGCNRSPMENALAPTSEDLEQGYGGGDPNLGGQQGGEAVVVGPGGITVLCTANPKGDGEHTWLIRLADDGTVGWQRHYPASQGVGRAIAALPGGGF